MSAAGTSRETPRIATVNLRRRVAMESGMCRSGAQRQDGRVEDVRERQTLGRERRNAVLRGNRQKAVSRDAEGGVMVEAAPAAAFEMPEPRPPASAPDIRARCACAAWPAQPCARSRCLRAGRACRSPIGFICRGLAEEWLLIEWPEGETEPTGSNSRECQGSCARGHNRTNGGRVCRSRRTR